MLSRVFHRISPIANGKYQWFHQSTRFMEKAVFQVEPNIPSTTTNNDNNCITTTIKSARSSYELLNTISKNVKTFSSQETLTALRTLFELQKDTSSSINPEEIGQNTDFERLCRSLKRNSRQMDLNDVIEALKIISFVGTSSKSEITMCLLHLIKTQINDVTLGHILFLDFLLRKIESNPLVDALLMSLPVLLQIQIGTQIDYENVTELTELLKFISRNRVSDQCTMNIVSALTLQGEELNFEQARSVIWSLSSATLPENLNYDKLLDNAIKVMKRHFTKAEFSAIDTTLEKMVGKYFTDTNKFNKFYDEELYKNCADFVVTNDLGFEKATYIQRQLNRVAFVHIKLLKHMLREVEKYPDLILKSKPLSLLTFITALSQANYKPENWNLIRPLILQSQLLTVNKRTGLPWAKLSIELLSLGIESPSIWNKMFSNEFLKIHLSQYRSKRLLRIFELYQHVKVLTNYNVRIDDKYSNEAKALINLKVSHPLKEYIESAFGGPSFVYTKVGTELGYVFDHIIGFDKQTMEPVRIENGQNYDVFDEDIKFDDIKTQHIAVVSFPLHCYCINIPILRGIYELKLRSYEKMGISVVSINPSTWHNLLNEEKIAYIQREVKLKLTQVLSD